MSIAYKEMSVWVARASGRNLPAVRSFVVNSSDRQRMESGPPEGVGR